MQVVSIKAIDSSARMIAVTPPPSAFNAPSHIHRMHSMIRHPLSSLYSQPRKSSKCSTGATGTNRLVLLTGFISEHM